MNKKRLLLFFSGVLFILAIAGLVKSNTIRALEVNYEFWITLNQEDSCMADLWVRPDKSIEDRYDLYFELSTDNNEFIDCTGQTIYQNDSYNPSGIFCHYYKIYGLLPNSTYYLRVSLGAKSTEAKSFKTNPDIITLNVSEIKKGQISFWIHGGADSYIIKYLENGEEKEISTASNSCDIFTDSSIEITQIVSSYSGQTIPSDINHRYNSIPQNINISLVGRSKIPGFNIKAKKLPTYAGYEYQIFEKNKTILSGSTMSKTRKVKYSQYNPKKKYTGKVRTYILCDGIKYYDEWTSIGNVSCK